MIADKLREVMEKRGLNQRDVERKTGVPNTTISGILTCKTKAITVDTLDKLCDGLGVSPNYFMGWDGDTLLWEFENLGVSREQLRELLDWLKKIKGAE